MRKEDVLQTARNALHVEAKITYHTHVKVNQQKRVAIDESEKKGYCDTRTADSSEPKDTQSNRKIVTVCSVKESYNNDL